MSAVPEPTRPTWRQREARAARVALLDPTLQPAGSGVSATLYEPDVLLVREIPGAADAEGPAAPSLDQVAAGFGWSLTPLALAEEPVRDADGLESRPRPRSARSTRVRISVASDAAKDVPVRRPDAWTLLAEARRAGARGVGLNHVMTVDPFTGNPFTGNPFTGNPFTGNPFTGNPFTGNPFTGNPAGLAGYAQPGLGGRQPVTYLGGPLPRSEMDAAERPVVAILDTGCGTHPWLAGDVVVDAKTEFGFAIGITDAATDPEANRSVSDVLDGVIDAAAGHGTFIAGIVMQACPDARILPVRISDSDGVILENDLLAALGGIVDALDAGKRIDVVNLSFGYYHESPASESTDSELYDLLVKIRAHGCVVVCSAGNDATDRPAAPASLHPWEGDDSSIDEEPPGLAPHVTVGALNPSGRSVALFSNMGAWVQTYARGVSVLSSIPTTFDGGVQAGLRDDGFGHRRETLDLDDFTEGYAVWSGTSFSAPLVAGRIAHDLLAGSRAGITQTPSTADVVAGVLEGFHAADLSIDTR